MEKETSPECWMDQKGMKKRFTEAQIKSLESMFGSETKLDPRKKQQLARELGMQPRQVAIWFQNKRARWKSKQLEREYSALREDYNSLLSNYEVLKKEKQMLSKQRHMLTEMMEKPNEGIKSCDCNKPGKEYQTESLLIAEKSNLTEPVPSADCERNFSNDFKEETELYLGQTASDFSSSSEKQLGLDPSWLSDQSSSNSQWWDFWPT